MQPGWTLELAPDEIPSAALLAALPSLIADASATAYAFPRRWVSIDGTGWHDEVPWNLDGTVRRLARVGGSGKGITASAPVGREEPILCTRLVGTTPEQRRRDVIEREIVERGGPGSLREARVRIHEPERFAVQAPVALSGADLACMGRRDRRAGSGDETLADGAVQVVRLPQGDPVLPAGIDDPDPDPSWPIARETRPVARDAGLLVPKVIHRVWLGGAPLPERYRAYGESWAHHHPGWEVRLWTDEDAPRPAGLERARNLAERADLTRYEIMRRHGGVYVDTDVECLRPIDDLVAGVRAFAAYEVPGRCCNAVLGAVPGHAAFEELVGLAGIVAGHGRFPEAMGTTFPTFVLEAHVDVTLFAPHRFYPDLWDGTLNEGTEPPYAHHHWAASWSDAAPAT